MRLLFWTGFWVFLVDQASKWFVVHYLDLITKKGIDIWPPFLVFRMAWNRGVNFGIGAGFDMRWVLVAIAFAISGAVLYWLWRRPSASKWTFIWAGFLVGGAMGNVIDRFLYGAVADFFNMSCCGFENPYAFNVADVAIFVGAVGIAFSDPDTPQKKRA